MSDKLRRSAVLIEPYKQLRFGVLFLTINFIFSILCFSIFYFFLSDVQQTLEIYFKLDAAQIGQIREKFLQPLMLAGGLFILFILVTLYISVSYTHKFYGPLVSIHRFLDELHEGKSPAPIRLRTQDQLQELADRLNRLLESKKLGNKD